MLEMDAALPGTGKKPRGFRGWKTVHDLDRRFAEEDRQMTLFIETEEI